MAGQVRIVNCKDVSDSDGRGDASPCAAQLNLPGPSSTLFIYAVLVI